MVQHGRLGRAGPARVVVHRDAVQQLGELRRGQALRALLDQPEPEVHVTEQPPFGSRGEGRPRPELECAPDVVDERRGEQQVTAEPRVQLRRLPGERRDTDRVLEQAARIGVMVVCRRRVRGEVTVSLRRAKGE